MTEEKQSAQRKARIIEVAREMIWEKGFSNTSMRDIARACSYEPSNTYNYFNSKEQLLFEILKEEITRMISSVRTFKDDDKSSPIDQIKNIVQQHIEMTLVSKKSSGLMLDVELRNLSPQHRKKIIELRDKYESILCKAIQRAIEQDYFVETDARLAAFMIFSMIVRCRLWFSPEEEKSPREIADFIVNFTLNGLMKEKKEKNRIPWGIYSIAG